MDLSATNPGQKELLIGQYDILFILDDLLKVLRASKSRV